MEGVRISSYFGPYFPAFGLNTDQHNYEYGHFLRGNSPTKKFQPEYVNEESSTECHS